MGPIFLLDWPAQEDYQEIFKKNVSTHKQASLTFFFVVKTLFQYFDARKAAIVNLYVKCSDPQSGTLSTSCTLKTQSGNRIRVY